MKKFELIAEQKITWLRKTLFRIKACIDFETNSGVKVHAGDLGGYLEYEDNLSQEGKAWVYGKAKVCENAYVHGNAEVYENAVVREEALIQGNAIVNGNAVVESDACISSVRHILCITPFDECGNSITFVRTRERIIKICYCAQTYTIEDFKNVISEWDNKKREIVIGAIEFAQKFIDLSDSEEK